MPKLERLDANEQLFFSRQLESVKAKTYDIQYPALKARQLFPVSFEAGAGATSITYRQYDSVGIAKIISNYASDLPRADVRGKEFTSAIRDLGAAYGWNISDIRKTQRAGVPLEQRRANAAKRAILQLENKIAFEGDSNYNLPGFLSNPNIPRASVLNDGTGAATVFTSKSADQILRDLNKVVNDVYNNTNEIEAANTLLLPPEQYTLISTLRIPNVNVTVKTFFLENNEFIKEIISVPQLRGKGTSGTDIMVAYDRNPDKLTLEIPTDFEQLPPEARGLEFIVNCLQTIGGVIIYAPLSINIAEGI